MPSQYTSLEDFHIQTVTRSRGGRRRWIRVNRGYLTPCWIWLMYIAKNGYAHQAVGNGKLVYAHRYNYENYHGVKVPRSKDMDHLCRIRHCVNPTHVEPVSRLTNAQRGAAMKLTPEKWELIKRLSAEKVPIRKIAKIVGVSAPHVVRVRQGLYKSWQ